MASLLRGRLTPKMRGCGMAVKTERTVVVDQSDPNRGRIDHSRLGTPHAGDTEPYPVTSPEDIEATRAELAELRRRMTRRTA